MSSLYPPSTSSATIGGGAASAQSSRLSALNPSGASPVAQPPTILPRVSIGHLGMVNPPGQPLSAGLITQRSDTVARMSGQFVRMTETALQIADSAVSQPIAVTDVALSMSFQNVKDGAKHTGSVGAEGQPPSTASNVGALVGVLFAVVDTGLSVYSLKEAVRAKNEANQEMGRQQDGATAFEDALQTRNDVAAKLESAKADFTQGEAIQPEFQAQAEGWRQALNQRESEYRQLESERSQIPPDDGTALQRGRTMLVMRGIQDRLAALKPDIKLLRTKLQDPEKTFLDECRSRIGNQPGDEARTRQLDAFERLKTLGDQIKELDAKQTELTDELRGLAAPAQSYAIARRARAEARRDTAETAVGVARAGAGLVRSGLDGTHAVIALGGSASGSGLVAASHIAGAAAGGLAIVAGGATIGIAAYRLNKATQRREAIQQAIAPATGQSNSEVLKHAGRHAVERRSTQITTSKWNIFKGVLGVVGGSLAIAAITATGVGALALGIAALGIGIASAATAIGTLCYGYRRGKADVALRNEVATEQARAETLEAFKKTVRDAATQANEPQPSDEALDKQAHEALIARNPYYAIQVFAEALTQPDTDPDRRAALEFLEASGLTGSRLEQVRLLSTEAATEEDKQLLNKSIESHLLG